MLKSKQYILRSVRSVSRSTVIRHGPLQRSFHQCFALKDQCDSLSMPVEIKNKIPFPSPDLTLAKFKFPRQTHSAAQISNSLKNFTSKELVTVHGWVNKKPHRLSKKMLFLQVRDLEGNLFQVISKSEEVVSTLRNSSIEDAICITGYIQSKEPSTSNGQEGCDENLCNSWDLVVESTQFLNRANDIPSQLKSLNTKSDAYPPEYRYLQLRKPKFQKALKTRSATAQLVRRVLTSADFTEIETPLLFKSTPEGAREFLVPTRKPDLFYALPQSPQQYKQLLMASGVQRYFQIAKCFRDEDLRADRQPEFTQIDLEMAFATGDDVRGVVSKTVTKVWKEIAGVPIMIPIGEDKLQVVGEDSTLPELTYAEVLTKYGIDKPDLRSSLTLQDLNELIEVTENEDFPVFEVCVLREAFNPDQKCKFPSQLNDPKEYKSRLPKVIPIRNDDDAVSWVDRISSIAKLRPGVHNHAIQSRLKLRPGDIIAYSTRQRLPYENPTPLGRFRQIAISAFPHKWKRALPPTHSHIPDEKIFVGSWVKDFPLFSPIELDTPNKNYPSYDYSKHGSTHHPFTMCCPEDYSLLETDPLKVRGEHYDLVMNGVELGGGSRRIHDKKLQDYIFQEILGIHNSKELFGHLLAAFDTGCPPHAGLAIGFDRMCAMLVGTSSIRDVVAFPKNMAGGDVVVNSPSNVSEKRLAEYHVKVITPASE